MAIWRQGEAASIGFFASFDQNFALARVIGGTDDPFLLHAFDDGSGSIIADLQAALDIAGRGLAVAQHDLHGLLIAIAALAFAEGALVEDRAADVIAFLGLGCDRFEIFRRSLFLQMIDHALDLAVGNERTVDARDTPAARHI